MTLDHAGTGRGSHQSSETIVLSDGSKDAHRPRVVAAGARSVAGWSWGPLYGGPGDVQVSVKSGPGSAWGQPVTLSSAEYAIGPELAVAGDGTIAATWTQTGQVFVSILTPGSDVWTNPVQLSDADPIAGGAEQPRIAGGPDGTVTVAWSQWAVVERHPEKKTITRERGVFLSSFDPLIGEWPPPVVIAGAHKVAEVACRPDGLVAVAWVGDGSVLVSTRASLASPWEGPESISAPDTRLFSEVQIVATVAGDLFAIWTCLVGNVEGFSNRRDAVQVAELRSGSRRWSYPETLYRLGDHGQAMAPSLAVDGTGAMAAVWWMHGFPYPQSGPAVVVSQLPAGASKWTAPGELTRTAIRDPDPWVAGFPEGGFVASWGEFDGRDARAQYSIIAPQGGSWTSPRSLSAAGASGDSPRVGVSGSRSAELVWRRKRDDRWRIESCRLEIDIE
jgi:hypothetical protein